ncbi:MAG: hypothetical protein M3455_02625 [Actinomycetota bacterium]|nr:hypothetical protein [Actinomycetota bacterium]
MLREGPIPRLVHGLLEYVVGVFLIAAPFLLGYDEFTVPLGASNITGVILLILAAITEGPTGLVHQLQVSAHFTIDMLLALFLIAAPFILGFADDSPTARNLFIALGVLHLLVSIGTRFREAAPRAESSSRSATSSKRPPTTAPTQATPTSPAPPTSGPPSGPVTRPTSPKPPTGSE